MTRTENNHPYGMYIYHLFRFNIHQQSSTPGEVINPSMLFRAIPLCFY
jgi:hypothetical protein